MPLHSHHPGFLAAPLALALGFLGLPGSGRGQVAERELAPPDPYTNGQLAALMKAGYASLGPFPFGHRHGSQDVADLLPDEPLVWLETAHFRIGCSLPPIAIRGEADSVDRARQELVALQARLPAIKPETRDLDRWLRAHLFAMRCEALYAEVCEVLHVQDTMFPKLPGHDPTLDPKRFRGLGPHLGMAEKFGVLLVRQGASLARYTRNWNGAESQRPTRYWVDGSALTFAIAEEAFDGHVRGDLELHTEVTFHLALLLYSGYRHYGHDLPPWLALGLAHWHARRVCPRYPAHLGRYDGDREERGFWKWDERSAGLLRSRAFEPLAVLMARTDIASFGFEQHMQSWALVDWLLRTKRAATCVLVHELKEPFHQLRRRPSPSELKRRGMQCLETAFGMTPTGLEEAWRADVAEK